MCFHTHSHRRARSHNLYHTLSLSHVKVRATSRFSVVPASLLPCLHRPCWKGSLQKLCSGREGEEKHKEIVLSGGGGFPTVVKFAAGSLCLKPWGCLEVLRELEGAEKCFERLLFFLCSICFSPKQFCCVSERSKPDNFVFSWWILEGNPTLP